MMIRNETTTLGYAGRSAVLASRLTLVAWVVGFALLTAVAAKVQVPMWPVPLTLQTAVVLLAGVVLGPAAGAGSQVLYLVMGLAGLPVFAGPVAGPAYFLLPTAGYLLAFAPAAAVAGLVAGPAARRTLSRLVNGAVAGTMVVFVLGVGWLAAVQQIGPSAALAGGLLPFLPGAAFKAILVVSVARVWDARRSRVG
jgi:biotin transport system substrate-specific component